MKDIADEICPDEIYLDVKKQESNTRRMCSLELYPEQLEDVNVKEKLRHGRSTPERKTPPHNHYSKFEEI